MRLGLLVALAGAAAPGRVAGAQQPAAASRVLSSETRLSRSEAVLELELAGGRSLELALRDGRVEVDGNEVGSYRRGDALDRSWRGLLEQAMNTENRLLPDLLLAWAPPESGPGSPLDAALEAALRDASSPAEAQAAPVASPDSISKLESRVAELEHLVQELKQRRAADAEGRGESGRRSALLAPFVHLWNGLKTVFLVLVNYAVLAGLGLGIVYFGRRHIEAVADTARHATLRSWFVGLAGLFLAIPAFILGIFALIVSIVGIPALLVWIPFFPVALAAALLFAYMAVAHAAGEALAERRLHGPDWLRRGNSYYYILTGLGLLLAPFLASGVVGMAGPWLSFIRVTLLSFAFLLTAIASTIGLGAFLLSRAGTRPLTRSGSSDAQADRIFGEEAHV